MAIEILRFAQKDSETVSIRAVKLPPRLQTIARCIEKDAAVADVGTDHGLLPVYLALNSAARSVIASDKSAQSLNTAIRNAVEHGAAGMIRFVVADGLTGICESDADTIVAAGLGGETIAKILEDAPWTKNQGVKLVLQPQTKIDKLCFWLRGNGYAIRDIVLTRDKGRVYTVVLAEGAHSGVES